MKVLAVTGGAQGIGRGVALHFAAAGYAVSIADTDAAAGAEALALFRARGAPAAIFAQADVSDPVAVVAWIERTVAELGVPDVLVNNAGIARNAPFLELGVDDFDRVLAVNLRGTFLCAQACARHMVRRGSGAIVNIASTRAFMSEPGTEAYSASKGGIVAITHAMAMSLANTGVRVNSISPGWIETRDWQASGRATTPVHSDADRVQHAAGRVGNPVDIAKACFYLVEDAGFVTGQDLVVDGGMTVKMIYAP